MPQAVADKQNIEKEAWELFEVGSYEDLIHLSSQTPGNALLADMAILSLYQISPMLRTIPGARDGSSVFSPLLLGYEYFYKNQNVRACEKISEYFKSKNPPVCFVIADFAVKRTFETGKFSDSLFIIQYYAKQEKSNPFVTEEIECLFELKKYQEVIDIFRKNLKVLSENYEIHRKCGIALTLLGKYKESEALLNNIPGRLELPKFEEKQKEFRDSIREIPEFEKRKNLSKTELNDLGFAYLFNSEFKKAERTFVKAVSLAK